MTTIREVYTARVADNADPEKRGRIRVTCVGIMGDSETTMAQWIEPLHDWGWFYVPDVGDLVEIEIHVSSTEDESRGQFSLDNMDPRWLSKQFFGDEKGAKPRPINAEFATNYGKRRGFATPAGHILMFDDTPGKEQVTLSCVWPNAFVTFDAKGSVTIQNKAGASIVMDAETGKITATSDEINLNGANQSAILGDLFKSYFDTHTHTAPTGPTSPPNVPMPDSTLSTTVKLG